VNALSTPVPLRPDHEFAHFDCGVPALDDWLKNRALKNESRFSRTFVASEDARVIAYYSIAVGAIERGVAPGALRRNAPDPIPVAIIGRLAVDRDFKGQGLGSWLLRDAVRRIVLVAQTIGIAAVLVQAKNNEARQFYLACAEFIEFPRDSRTLFLPIGMAAKLI